MAKDRRKIFKRKIGFVFIRLFTTLIWFLALGGCYRLGKAAGNLFYLFARHQRKIALENLSLAFSQLSFKERQNIAKNFFIFMVQSSLEMIHAMKHPQASVLVRIEGKENLDAALKRNKGVICLTAHFGNFPLLCTELAKKGYPVNVVVRPLRDEQTSDYLQMLRTQAGVKTIFSYPRKEAVATILQRLRKNEIVLIQMDQNFGTGGVWVKFFGKLAATPVGPIVFALRTGAAVLPIYIVRQTFGKHCIKILPAQELKLTSDKDETILLNAAKFTAMIEDWIRQYPWQWGWIHRRWKSQPPVELKKEKFKIQREYTHYHELKTN